ncbi:MAG: tRNA lysidine(34) synthetase TilS [Elusimicrobia bacterium]|nr:tRNA lysidine(34) synthetase TilS [Elusimicrobiota bacterium]
MAPRREKKIWGALWPKIRSTVQKNHLLSPGDRVLVAFSGGPDSTCLAHALKLFSVPYRLQLFLVHFNHGLRGKACERDAQWTQRWARKQGLPIRIFSLPTRHAALRRGNGTEEAARYLRYRRLENLARNLRCQKIATGHTLDDHAETVLLHLLRGRPRGRLKGIPVLRRLTPRSSRRLIRPLLGISHAQVLRYLKAHRLRFRQDSTNRSLRFTRNRIRRRLMPLLERFNPKIRERLASLASEGDLSYPQK